jgi:hypothetical protein
MDSIRHAIISDQFPLYARVALVLYPALWLSETSFPAAVAPASK